MPKRTQREASQIDLTVLHSIFGSNPTSIAKHIKSFIAATTEVLQEAINAIQVKNKNQAMNRFHCLKGPVGCCGFTKIYKLCEKAEEQIMLEDWVAAMKFCQDIKKAVTELQCELEKNY